MDLRGRREALGLSRARLAAIVGFSPAHIAQLEDGYRPRRGNAVARIILALNEQGPHDECGPAHHQGSGRDIDDQSPPPGA